MAVNRKVVLRRIKSVRSTQKITKAMELVASAKMRKATQAVLGSRPYMHLVREAIADIRRQHTDAAHPLLTSRGEKHSILLILLMSDRGLCGSYNAQMARAVRAYQKDLPTGTKLKAITIGKRAAHAARRLTIAVDAAYMDVDIFPGADAVRGSVQAAIDGYLQGHFDGVVIGYTDFRSALSQIPRFAPLLPLAQTPWDFGSIPEHLYTEEHRAREQPAASTQDFLFEPTVSAVLDCLLPRFIEAAVYQALLEAQASEQAARMLAMRHATDAAADMLEDLTLTYNAARQSQITQEIAEISGGKAALDS